MIGSHNLYRARNSDNDIIINWTHNSMQVNTLLNNDSLDKNIHGALLTRCVVSQFGEIQSCWNFRGLTRMKVRFLETPIIKPRLIWLIQVLPFSVLIGP